MKQTIQNKETNNKLLASYALFKELTKNGKHIHDVLSDFLIDIMISKQLYSFDVSTINGHLKSIYEFQIPDAVVKTLLKRLDFLKYEFQIFTVSDMEALSKHHTNTKEVELEDQNNEIVEKLYEYISNKQEKELKEKEKQKILQSFTDFILDKSIDNCYADDISLFIIDNEDDKEFINNLQTIKDGVILYTGIKYNQNFDLHAAWKSNLTIYLNTEIIFHLAGYNGEIFKTLFFDFYDLVKEINSSKKYIYLKIFKETKEEIESFFYKAEKIIKGFDSLNPATAAMKNIVNGCDDVTSIIAKKVQLFSLIDTLGIKEETEEEEITYAEDNYRYNILSTDLLKEQFEKDDSESTDLILKLLNTINIKRGEREKFNLEDIGYIFLTENRKVRTIAWNEEIKEQGIVPLATTLQFLTNRFWFKLNKGFGNEDTPSSFSVITKAQVLLSYHVSEKINKEYHALKKALGEKKLTEDEVILILHELRERAKLPEEITISNVPSILTTISTESYEQFIIEKNDIHRAIAEKSKENSRLKSTLDNTSNEKEKLSQETRALKENFLKEKERNFKHLMNTKDRVNLKIDKRYKRLKIKYFTPLPLLYFLLAIGTYFIGWDTIEPLAWILTISIPFIGSFLYLYKEEKSFNIMHILEDKKQIIIDEEARKEDFHFEEIEAITNDINDLKKELYN